MLVAYFVERYADRSRGRAKPPNELVDNFGMKSISAAYEFLFPVLGDTRPIKTFLGSMNGQQTGYREYIDGTRVFSRSQHDECEAVYDYWQNWDNPDVRKKLWLKIQPLFEQAKEKSEPIEKKALPDLIPVDPPVTYWTEPEQNVDSELEDSWALVKQRRKQSKFRQIAINNFGGACCLTGVTDLDLLVAAHIVRWADDSTARLDPANGLLLYHEYDLLFENGYFYFDENFIVRLAHWTDQCGEFIRARLKAIEGNSIAGKATLYPTKSSYLRTHRARIEKLSLPSN